MQYNREAAGNFGFRDGGSERVCRGTVVVGLWTISTLAFAGSGASIARVLALALVAAGLQLYFAARTAGIATAGTRALQTSQVWIAAAAAIVGAVFMRRLLPVDVELVGIATAAVVSGLSCAVVQEVSAARSRSHRQRAVIIGTGEEAAEWIELLDAHPEMGIDVVGCVGDESKASSVGIADRWLASTADMLEVMDSEQIELPIVSVTSFRRPGLHDVVDRLLSNGHDVAMSWGVGRLSSARLSSRTISHETLPVIRVHRPSKTSLVIKRVIDFTAASVLLTLAAPLVFLAAIIIRRQSDGPAFFRQSRIGQGGKPFEMIKLRTMTEGAASERDSLTESNERTGPLFKMTVDPRVTPIGRILRKTSIDEVPQLLNVLRGEMSMVGPRPALPEECEQFDEELMARAAVRPGITGLWQLEARSNRSFHAYKRLDLHYLENWSLGLDLRIMIATAQLLVLGPLVAPLVKRLVGGTVGESANSESVVTALDETAIDETAIDETAIAGTAIAGTAISGRVINVTVEQSVASEIIIDVTVDPALITAREQVVDIVEPALAATTEPALASPRDIAVLGAGYVGLTQALGLVKLGHRVVCADINQARIVELQAGIPPILEAGLEELLAESNASGRITFTPDPVAAVAEAEFVFLCVATPQGDSGAANLEYLEAAATQIGPHLKSNAVVINKSTVPVGSAALVAERLGRADATVVSNPEFLREGTAIADWLAPDRILVGGDREAAERVLDLYLQLPGHRVVCDAASAELIKYASNAYLATRLTFVNSMSAMCSALGADVTEVTRAMGLDRRIGSRYLSPGPGWGGSCLPKDTHALAYQARQAGIDFRQLEATIEGNDVHLDRCVNSILDAKTGSGPLVVAVLGMAFKSGTGDTRDSPAVKIMERLLAAGAEVKCYDPGVVSSAVPGVELENTAVDCARGADVLAVLTEWPDFATLDFEKVNEAMRTPVIVDLRNMLDPQDLAELGFEYRGVGRSPVLHR